MSDVEGPNQLTLALRLTLRVHPPAGLPRRPFEVPRRCRADPAVRVTHHVAVHTHPLSVVEGPPPPGSPSSPKPHPPGVTDPSTTRRRAPVAAGTFDGSPSSVAAASKANAIASFASDGTPTSSLVFTGTPGNCLRR